MTTAADFARDVWPDRVDRKFITGTVLSLAKGIYDDSATDRLPVLADALEEAGVSDPKLLTGLRNADLSDRDKWVYLSRVLTREEVELMQWIPQGSIVYAVLRHVSRSGMLRFIDFFTIKDDKPLWLSAPVGELLDLKRDRRKEGLRIHGAGMDMGFYVTYELANRLYGNGYALESRWI